MTRVFRPLVSLVIPVYGEAACIGPFAAAVDAMASGQDFDVEMIFVNDGSTDDTFERLRALQRQNPAVTIVNLTRNFGKEAALTAGLAHAAGDCAVPIDVDLEQPPTLIPAFVEKWRAGADVVIARRSARPRVSALKMLTSRAFYRVFNRMARLRIPSDTGDYRLMDRRVVEAVLSLGEGTRFMKGLFAWVGYATAVVEFVPEPRRNGRSKFGIWKLWNFALDGIFGFTTIPLRVWTYIGAAIALLAFFYGAVIVLKTIIFGIDAPGYASLISVVLFLGGIQLISLGIIGEYVGRIAMEVKRRPLYLIENVYRAQVAEGRPGQKKKRKS